MLKPQLQKSLDEKWNNCWPVSDLRPLVILDLVSYLFFIKKLDDWGLIHPKLKDSALENFVYSKEIEAFTWSKLALLNARQIQQLFIREYGIVDLMRNYAELDSLYSDYFKAPLLIEPTPKLLFNCIEIVNIIETSDKKNQTEIVEYLFGKSKKTTENRQEFLPDFVSKLMVGIAAPDTKDVIADPSAGNGSLLINAFTYQENLADKAQPFFSNKLTETNLSGAESNLINLRLAAMNMILHGIKNPKIHIAPFGEGNLKQMPSLIISSLIFSNETVSSGSAIADVSKTEKEHKLLKKIIDHLATGSRAVVLVPQAFLKSDDPAIVKTRKTIVDQHQLEAVITLRSNDSMYSGAAILVFNKSQFYTTEQVWFFKWETDNVKDHKIPTSDDDTSDFGLNEVKEILNKWKTKKDQPVGSTRNSFFIAANFIKNNKYDLNFNNYKVARQQKAIKDEEENDNIENETIMSATKENLHEFFDTSELLPEVKKRRSLTPVVIILVLVLGAGAFYWIYFRNNSYHFLNSDTLADSTSNIKIINPKATPNSVTHATTPKSTETATPGSRSAQSDAGVKKYIVIDKAWFHYEPDSSKIKPVFLNPRKDIVLTPKSEQNGFVYVVYVNNKGQATHGWLSKKKLEVVE